MGNFSFIYYLEQKWKGWPSVMRNCVYIASANRVLCHAMNGTFHLNSFLYLQYSVYIVPMSSSSNDDSSNKNN
jgi:hypothetical protein